jgi:ribokinase
MVKIVVLASFNMDLVMRAARHPRPGETLQGDFAMYLGGKGFNQAIAASRLGAEVSVIGRVGDDEFGRRFLEALAREGIDRTAVSIDPDAGTGAASIVVDDSGENAIIQAPQANTTLTYEDVLRASERTVIDGRTVPLNVADADALLATLETPPELAFELADTMCHLGRKPYASLNPAPASRIHEGTYTRWGTLTPNAIEAEAMTGLACSSPEAALAAASKLRDAHGCEAVAITLGARGAVAVDRSGSVHVPAFDVEAVDTVGAGDAFCAALAVATLEGADVTAALRFANAAGALATMTRGAEPSMPRRDEVDSLLAKGRTR